MGSRIEHPDRGTGCTPGSLVAAAAASAAELASREASQVDLAANVHTTRDRLAVLRRWQALKRTSRSSKPLPSSTAPTFSASRVRKQRRHFAHCATWQWTRRPRSPWHGARSNGYSRT